MKSIKIVTRDNIGAGFIIDEFAKKINIKEPKFSSGITGHTKSNPNAIYSIGGGGVVLGNPDGWFTFEYEGKKFLVPAFLGVPTSTKDTPIILHENEPIAAYFAKPVRERGLVPPTGANMTWFIGDDVLHGDTMQVTITSPDHEVHVPSQSTRGKNVRNVVSVFEGMFMHDGEYSINVALDKSKLSSYTVGYTEIQLAFPIKNKHVTGKPNEAMLVLINKPGAVYNNENTEVARFEIGAEGNEYKLISYDESKVFIRYVNNWIVGGEMKYFNIGEGADYGK